MSKGFRNFRFYVVPVDAADLWMQEVYDSGGVVARIPSGASELFASPERFLFVGGQRAIGAELDPQYRPAQLLCDHRGNVVAVAFVDFALPDAHVLPHSVCYLRQALANKVLVVVFAPSADRIVRNHTDAPFVVKEGRRVAFTVTHYPRETFGPNPNWWHDRLIDDSPDSVFDAIRAALPTDSTLGFRHMLNDAWRKAEPSQRFARLILGIQNSLMRELHTVEDENSGGSLGTETDSWPWERFPCVDEPEHFGKLLHERAKDRQLYALNDQQFHALRRLMLPCGLSYDGRWWPADTTPRQLYGGIGHRTFLTGTFRLGEAEFGVVQARNGLRLRSHVRTALLPFRGERFEVVATLIKERDHNGSRNPEEQRGIGLIQLFNPNRGE